MGNKILDYTSIGEKKGKFDALANNIKDGLNNISSGLGYLEKGTITEEKVEEFQSQIRSRVEEIDEIAEKFKNYLSYIIESNKDEDSKQASEVAEEVGLMKEKSKGSNNNGGGSNGGGSSGGGSNGGGSAPSSQASTTVNLPQQPDAVQKTDYETYKKETSDKFQKVVEDQKKVDEVQDKKITTLTNDFNKYKIDNDKVNVEQDKKIQEVFDRLKGQDSRITNLENKTNAIELSKTNTVTVPGPAPTPSYTPSPASPAVPENPTPSQTNTQPTTPEQPKVETPKVDEPKKEEIIEESPIDTKTPMEIDPSKYDQDLSQELGVLDPSTNTSALEGETPKDENGFVKAAAFGALGLGALGLGGGALYYHNKKKEEENMANEEYNDDNDYLYDDEF